VSFATDLVTALNLPNLLSLVRLVLIPFFVVALAQGDFPAALGIFAAAAVTDALDGLIARRWNLQTPVGAFLDPLADKLLMTTAFVTLALRLPNQREPIPLLLTILVISRDVIIVLVSLAIHLTHGIRKFNPSWWGKVNTVLQMATVSLVLLVNAGILFVPWIGTLYLITLGSAVVSGIHYLFRTERWLKRESPPAAASKR
jgi:cardiolipin synthase